MATDLEKIGAQELNEFNEAREHRKPLGHRQRNGQQRNGQQGSVQPIAHFTAARLVFWCVHAVVIEGAW